VRHRVVAFIALSFAVLAAACEDPNAGLLDPALVTDTIQVSAPTPVGGSVPSALDLSALTLRFPEKETDAANWDLALRVRDGQLVFLPAGYFGIQDPASAPGVRSKAGITHPITDQTLESLREAPASDRFVTDSAVVMQVGALYAARSRGRSCGFTTGYNYAKIKILSADAATGQLSLVITVNQNCGDLRLVPVD
jgi:hypothetical protein